MTAETELRERTTSLGLVRPDATKTTVHVKLGEYSFTVLGSISSAQSELAKVRQTMRGYAARARAMLRTANGYAAQAQAACNRSGG
jgi:hypothetical protein